MVEVNAYIGLGSNLGDRQAMIRSALTLLDCEPGIKVLKHSSIVETKPIGPPDQDDYLNTVALVRTTLEPLALLDKLQEWENTLGRRRDRHWGPRTIDLDILLYGDLKIDLPRLKIPHPEIPNRPFVQEGLQELAVHG